MINDIHSNFVTNRKRNIFFFNLIIPWKTDQIQKIEHPIYTIVLYLAVAYRYVSEYQQIHKIRVKVHPPREPKFTKMWEKGVVLFARRLSPSPITFDILAPLLLILAATNNHSTAAQMVNAYILVSFRKDENYSRKAMDKDK